MPRPEFYTARRDETRKHRKKTTVIGALAEEEYDKIAPRP